MGSPYSYKSGYRGPKSTPMPDRAVVDEETIRFALREAYECGCDKCGGEMVLWQDIGDMKCEGCGRTGDAIEREMRGEAPQPRALVAMSDDRQWLVRLDSADSETHDGPQRFWTVFEEYEDGYLFEDQVCDTGQDAQAVLQEFLASKED